MGWKEFLSSPQTARWKKKSLAATIVMGEETFLKGNDNDVINWITRHPESCQTKMKVDGQVGELSPLTVVCRKRLSLETIQAVHKAYPKAILEDPSLHHALANQASLDVIKYLVSENPESIFSRKSGWLPMHTACANEASLDIIEYLYRCYPEAIHTHDLKEYKLPLHLAVEEEASVAVVQFLIDKYPKGTKIPDYEIIETKTQKRGYLIHKAQYKGVQNHWNTDCGLPLHMACVYHASLPIIRALYKAHPNGILTKNKNGYLPIHLAAKTGAPLSIISYLTTLCPESIVETTLQFDNTILLACNRGWDAKLQTIQYLLSQQPAVSGGPPPTGWFREYLDEAHEFGAHPKIVSFLRDVVRASRQGYSCVRTFDA